MQGEFVLDGEFGEAGDVVDDAVGEVGGGANEEDGVWVYEAGDGAKVDLVGGRLAGDEVDLDFEVLACFAEGRVCGFGKDHFGLGDGTFGEGFVAGGKAGHEDGFGAAAGRDAAAAFGGVEEGEDLLALAIPPRLCTSNTSDTVP